MICWDSVDGQIIGIFTPRQIRWIRKHVGALHAAAHEFAFAAEVPAFSANTSEFNVIRRTLADAAVVLDTLPGAGGVVVLPNSDHAWAWIWSLSECRTHLAFRLGLARGPAQTLVPPRPGADGRIERSLSTVTNWLAGVVSDLIRVADLNYPEVI